MADNDRTRAGQTLLEAHRDLTGPTPEAEARLLAALQRSIADLALPTGPSGHVVRDISVTPPPLARRRHPWRTTTILLAATAVLIGLALRAQLGASLDRPTDPAAAYQARPDDHDRTTARPRTLEHIELPAPRPIPHTIPEHTPAPPPTPPAPEPIPSEPAPRVRREPPPPAIPAPSLADEMRSMRPAQRALAAGDPIAALAQLERYAREFPDGHLREEYLAMRAIARCDADHVAGPTDAAQFLRARPLSIFAERVRNACVH